MIKIQKIFHQNKNIHLKSLKSSEPNFSNKLKNFH